jgi:AraC-like DNA-binding protein
MGRLEETRPSGNGRARGLVSSRVSGARVTARTFAPPPGLEDVVECFWLGRWNLPDDAPHTTHLLGDPCVHVCFETTTMPMAPTRRLVGVWTTLWERRLAGRGGLRAVKLKAGAAGAFVDDASASRNRILDLDAAFGAAARDPGLERCADAADVDDAARDDAAFAALARWLGERRRHDPDTRLAVEACAAIKADLELVRVDALEARMGLSTRALQRLFRRHVGAPPKFVIRRARLQEAAVRLERGEPLTLADLAAELGYADQAHLARDFKHAVRLPPAAFARAVHR